MPVWINVKVFTVIGMLNAYRWRLWRRLCGVDALGAAIMMQRKSVVYVSDLTSAQIEGMLYLERLGLVRPDRSDPESVARGIAALHHAVGTVLPPDLAHDMAEQGMTHWHPNCNWSNISQWVEGEASRLRVDPSNYVVDDLDRHRAWHRSAA